ncbi:unnamed protein product (macronuclear) [Paramecium tetraurelia]|uniref:Protein kinase domain-containing protein n=1 Tax=Paramecium tetraurelia TaxID=5888 RepID=A0BND3_PARTE|nr:uncharacterized protein GSPATT00030688001 [Paramecium tetraurelia]CAK60050.1 unnamed protein product [Paramecium tetraurelia]|eukprot:XP_001427448.1 hypothetical protein (macronuclear) [Paramecium tetraurelia strain d4-2]
MKSNLRELYHVEENQKGFIAQGAFSHVYACRRKNGNQQEPLCVKIIKKKIYTMNRTLQEIEILNEIKQLKSENLLHIDHISESESQFEVVMERCDMDLEQEFKLLKSKNKWYTEQDCLNIVTQIMNGIRVLYNKNIIHRDIKPANILVKIINTDKNEQKRVYQIADFGFSRILNDFCGVDYYTQLGTPLYASPQIFGSEPYSGKCDIYSLGILFYQLFFEGNMPNQLQTKGDLLNFHKTLENKQFKFNSPKYHNAKLITHLLQLMIVYKEEERISFEQIFQHQILKIKISFNYSDSIFSEVQQGDCLNKLYAMQLQLYRKYLFYKSVSQKLVQSQQIEVQAALYCLTQLGFKQLHFCLGFIHIIISDIHPHFNKDNIYPLLQELKLCEMNIDKHPQYQLLIKIIKQKYYSEKGDLQKQMNQLETEQNSNTQKSESMRTFMEIFQLSKSANIEQKQLTDLLQLFLEQKLLIGFEADIKKSILLEERFPIQNSQDINPDDIFKV